MIGYLKDRGDHAGDVARRLGASGDRGFLDHTGRAYFAGRYKAMIKRSGENISAEEVEAAIAEHPGVAECVVVAVPDRIRTEEVGAIVVRRATARWSLRRCARRAASTSCAGSCRATSSCATSRFRAWATARSTG